MTDVIQPVLALWRSPPTAYMGGLLMLTDSAEEVPSADEVDLRASRPLKTPTRALSREHDCTVSDHIVPKAVANAGVKVGLATCGRFPETPFVKRTQHVEYEEGSECDSLDGDMGTDPSDQEDLGSDSDHAEVTGAAMQPTTRLSNAEYLQIGRLLIEQLVRGEEQGVQVRESELIEWYRTQAGNVPDELLHQRIELVNKVLRRMIDIDRSIVVSSGSHELKKPGDRVLTKHPRYVL